MATSQELYNAYMTRATTGSLDFGSLTLTAGRSAFAGFPALTSVYFDGYQTVDSPSGAYLAPSSFNDLNGNPMTIVFPSDKHDVWGTMTDDILDLIEMSGQVRTRVYDMIVNDYQDFTAKLPKSCIHTTNAPNGGNLDGWAELTDLSNLIYPYKIFVWIRRDYFTSFYYSHQHIAVAFKLVTEMSDGQATKFSGNMSLFSKSFSWLWTHNGKNINRISGMKCGPVSIDFKNASSTFKEIPSISFIDKRKFVETDIVTDIPVRPYGGVFNPEPVIFKENCFIVPTTTEMTEYSYINGEIDERYPKFQINSKMGFYTINISSGTNRNYLGVGEVRYDPCSIPYDTKFTAVKYSAHKNAEGELVKDQLLDRKNVHENLIIEGDSLVWTGDDVNKWYMIDVGYVGSWEVNFTCSGDSKYNNIVSITCDYNSGYDKGYILFGNKCFFNSSYLTSVDVYNCNEIGESAFEGCTNLVNFYMEAAADSVERRPQPVYMNIYSKAFSGCTKLENFSCDNTEILHISSNAFRGCSSLDLFSNGISSAYSIGDAAFYGCSKLDLRLNSLKAHASIGPSAFAYSGINRIELFSNDPETTYYASIPEKCFFSCTSSDGFANLNYVSSVGASAFGSTPLIRINFNRGITRDSSVGHEPPVIFDKAAFAGISTLKSPPPSSTILPIYTNFYEVSGIIYINCTVNNSFDGVMFNNIINDANFPFGANNNVLFIGNPNPEYDFTNNCSVYYGITGAKAISSIRIAI